MQSKALKTASKGVPEAHYYRVMMAEIGCLVGLYFL